MQAFGEFLNGYANVHNQLWEHLRAKTFALLDEHTKLKAAMATPEEVAGRAAHIRQAFLDSIGGLPDASAPLNPQVIGTVARPGYTIEKVIFQSEPGVYVTALCYVPEGLDAPAPGILFVCGHAREAKGYPEYQRVCHDLARNGFVVLAVDPTGQGERVTHLDPDSGHMVVQWGTTEHSYHGFQCILTGTSVARYFLFDALRGIDYLQSRPEVDADRIGVTGNSGGGTQTSLLCMSGDERIKAAAPCTYVTSREHYYMTGQPQDAEQLQFGMVRDGVNFEDFFIPFAPRPLLIGAVDSDYFCPEGTAQTYERLRHVYGVLGAKDDVAWELAPGLHKYCTELRQAAVNWFRKHLQGEEPDFVTRDEDIEILPDADLWCTKKGHVLTDFPDARTPYHRNVAVLDNLPATKKPEHLREAVMKTLCFHERLNTLCPLYPRHFDVREFDGLTAQSLFFLSEPGIMTSACLLKKKGVNPETATIFLAEGGTNAMDHHAEAWRDMVARDEAVLYFDVRGKGAVAATPVNARADVFPGAYYATESWFSFQAYCLGDCLLGMRVFDVLRAVQYLEMIGGYERIGLYAKGIEPSLWGYLAAAVEPMVDPVRIDGLLESFEAVVRTQLYRTDLLPSMMVHGILQHFDLPDLAVLFEGRALDVAKEPVAWRS